MTFFPVKVFSTDLWSWSITLQNELGGHPEICTNFKMAATIQNGCYTVSRKIKLLRSNHIDVPIIHVGKAGSQQCHSLFLIWNFLSHQTLSSTFGSLIAIDGWCSYSAKSRKQFGNYPTTVSAVKSISPVNKPFRKFRLWCIVGNMTSIF